jgi:hypothetical protein
MSLEALIRLTTWRRYAACRGRGALFYASDPMSQAVAVAICESCGVREACAADAAVEEAEPPLVFGVRAGMTAGERMAALANSRRPLDAPLEFAGRLRVS